MDPLLIALGTRLRARRLALGLTQATLSQAAGVSVRFLVWQDAATHPLQTTDDVPFTLSLCT